MDESNDSQLINPGLIRSPDGRVLEPAELISPDQQALLDSSTSCDKLSLIYHKEFTRNNNRVYLDHAIYCSRRCLALCPPDNPLRRKWLYRLANHLASRCDRFDEVEGVEGVEEAVELLQESLRAEDVVENPSHGYLGGRQRARALYCLARVTTLRYQYRGSPEDFGIALDALLEALDLYEDLEIEEKCAHVGRLIGSLYQQQYLKNPDGAEATELLDNAIEWNEDAIRTSKGYLDWGFSVAILADLLERRYDRLHNTNDLLEAIERLEELYVEQTVVEGRATWEDTGRIHFYLGRLYMQLTSITQSAIDGSEASSYARMAVHFTAPNHPERAMRELFMDQCLETLATTVGLDLRGRPPNVQVKEQMKRISLAGTDPTLEATLMEELSSLHNDRYKIDGSILELKKAKDSAVQAAMATPQDESTAKVRRYEKGAIFCIEIAQRTFDDDYLDEGMALSREAVKVCRDSSSISTAETAISLGNLTQIIVRRLSEGEEDGIKRGSLTGEGLEVATEAASLIRQACSGSDGCEYCRDRRELTENLELFKRRYGTGEAQED